MSKTLYSILYNHPVLDTFPPNKREALLLTAQKFDSHENAHFLGLDELRQQLGGSVQTWREFLSLKPVKDYIELQLKRDLEISHRQALASQAKEAILRGDTQAAKFINELMEQTSQQNNTKIILHYVPRPQDTTL